MFPKQKWQKNRSLSYLTSETIILSFISDRIEAFSSRLHAQPRNILAIAILISIVFFGFSSGRLPLSPTASADSARMVSLYADGQKKLFATDASTVGDVLARANVKLGTADLVEPSADTVLSQGPYNINVFRARPVLVVDGLHSYNLRSAYESPRLLAAAAGLKAYPEDEYRTEVITDIVGNSAIGEKVVILRSKPVSVKVDGKVHELRTQSDKVGDVIKNANIALGANDAVSIPLTAPVWAGMSVSITRVSEAVVTLTQALPRSVKTIEDPAVLKGQTSVRTEGSDGQKTTTFRVHYKDGVETAREVVQVVSQTDPVARVVVVGTKVIFAGSIEYWRPQVEAAAADYGLDPNMMLRIMSCESHGNASSVSNFIVNGEHPTGLFQYLPSTWRSAGGTDNNIFDGSLQIRLTAKKMAAQGTGAWQCK